jgi:hypothetical protein
MNERWLGEILLAANERGELAKGTVLAGRDAFGSTKMEPPTDTPTLAEMGLTKKWSAYTGSARRAAG